MNADIATLWHTYAPKIHAYVYRRTSDPVLSEDLTAQTFLRALEALRCGQGPRTSLSGWIYRIAHNLIIDYYRVCDRRPVADLDETLPWPHPLPSEMAELQLDFDAVAWAMRRLTDEQAQVLQLRYIDGYAFGEIAVVMGKTEGAVKALQRRALATLKLLLEEKLAA